MMASIEFPAMRDEVLAALRSLASESHQREQWGRYSPDVQYYDDLSLNIHALYDDCAVLPDPRQALGTVLEESDIAPLAALEKLLGPLIDELGNRPDRDYLNHPTWPEIVQAARIALTAMESANAGEG